MSVRISWPPTDRVTAFLLSESPWGVHYRTIAYLERGEYSPSLYLALKIAAYFDVPLEVVFSTEPFARLGSEGQSG